MSLARSGISLLLGLAAITAAITVAITAAADPPAAEPGPPKRDGRLSVARDPARDSPSKAAMALHDEAWVLYEEGKYRAAVAKLEAALRIDPDGRELVYNLALLHEKLADLKESASYYRQYLEKEPDPKARARVQASLRRLEGAEKEAAATSLPPVASPAPPPPPAPRPVQPAVVVSGSLAGAALIMGTVFGIAALSRNPGSNASTGNGVSVDDLQAAAHTAHIDAMVADISFVVTAVAASTAAVLYLTTPHSARVTASSAVVVGPGLFRASF
jgi:hypothetical protein